MKYENTDKIISEKYLSEEPDFDAEGTWKELEQKINPNRKKRVVWWYAAGLSLFILLAFYLMPIWNAEHNKVAIISAIDPNIEFLQETTTFSSLDGEKTIKDPEQKSPTKTQYLSNLDSNSGHSNIEQNNVGAKETFSALLIHSEKNDQKEIEESSNRGDVSATNSKLDNLIIQNQNNSGAREVIILDLLKDKLQALDYNREMTDSPEHTFMKPLTQNSNKSKFRLGINGGYFIHSRSLQNSGVSSNENFTSRTNEEDAIDAFDLGLKLDYFLTNNLVVYGGLRFDHSYVERNADYIYLESITIPDHIVVVIKTEGGTIEQTGSITYDGYYHHKSNNYLTSKRVGALAGLQYRMGNGKWKSHLNLGIEVPVWTKVSGVITNDGKPYNLSDGNLDLSKKQLLVFGGVGAEYSIADGVGLQVIVGGYLPTGNEYKESYNIIKKSTQLGVNFGIHFQL